MRSTWWLGFLLGLFVVPLSDAAVKPAAPGVRARLDAVTLLIRHRVFHDFGDLQRVKPKQDFILGDTDYSARVVQYVPDFTMDLKTRSIVSKSDQPHNPAFKIIVFQKGVPQDTTWALLNMPPHFARNSLFAFKVVRIDFVGRAPIIADTSSATPTTPPAHPAAPGAKEPSSAR